MTVTGIDKTGQGGGDARGFWWPELWAEGKKGEGEGAR
jgi:hypothetical protein